MQLGQDSGKLLAGYVEQGGIGKDGIKRRGRQIECQKFLAEYVAAAVLSRHLTKIWAAIKTHWPMA